MPLNEAAYRLVEPLVGDPRAFGATVGRPGGVTVVDCGVKAVGNEAAGLLVARGAMAGLGRVECLEVAACDGPFATLWPDCPWPIVAVASDAPVAACLAAQYAGWKVATAEYFAMASGPIRAAIGREKLFETIGLRERPSVAVGVLEASRLPPEDVCIRLATDAGVDPAGLLLLVADGERGRHAPGGRTLARDRAPQTPRSRVRRRPGRAWIGGRAAAPIPRRQR